MSKQAKILVSIVGLAAIIVPAVLLVLFSSGVPKEPQVDSASRKIDAEAIDSAVKNQPQAPQATNVPSPFATSSASVSPAPSEEIPPLDIPSP